MWLAWLPSSSSKVMNRTVLPAFHCWLAKSLSMNLPEVVSSPSQESPVEIEQSCMSLHVLGVTNVNAADRSGVAPSGRSWSRHVNVRFEQYGGGLCRHAQLVPTC